MGVERGCVKRIDTGEQRVKQSSTHHISAVIEWSPNGVSGYRAETKSIQSAPTVAGLGAVASNGSAVVVAVSRRTVFIKPVRVPNAGETEIRQILRIQLDQLFPVQQGELAYDLWLTPNVTSEGKLVVVCGMKTDLLKELHGQLSDASVKNFKVVPAALGSVLIAKSLGQKNCTVIDTTFEGLALDVVCDGELRYSRVVPYTPGETNVQAEIARTLAIAGVDSCPTISAAQNLLPEADYQAQMGTLAALSTPQALGLHVQLEPPEAAEKRRQQKVSNRFRLATLIAGVAAIVWTADFLEMSDRAKAIEKADRVHYERMDSLKDLKSQLKKNNSVLQAANDTLQKGFAPAQKFTDVLTVIGDCAPQTVWLSGVTLERGRQLSIRGTSLSSDAVAKFVEKMTSQPRFRDVKLVFANNGLIEATPIVQFSVTAHVVGNLPLRDRDINKRTK